MNSPKDLNYRLLKLYPVKIVKEHFEPEETTQIEMLPEILNNNNAHSIHSFALENHNYTKQHISIFKLNSNFVRNTFNFNGLIIQPNQEIIVDGGYLFKFLPIIDYEVVLGDPYSETILQFYQPTSVKIIGDIIIISTTIMEKNLESYFPGRRVYDAKKSQGEDSTVKLITDHFELSYGLVSLDINRGIKYLWANDMIDSKYAKWKKSHSTTTENMDEEYTLKQKYPQLYQDIIQAPIGRTIFKNITDDDIINSHFSVDPSKGLISISIYPDNLNQTNNVLNEIISNN